MSPPRVRTRADRSPALVPTTIRSVKSSLGLRVFVWAVACVSVAPLGADEIHPAPRFTRADRREAMARAFPEIERYLAGRMASDHVPGLAFGIVIDGELAYGKGLGVRDTAAGAPVDLDTAFRIASMTKSFTALSILKLRDEGRLSLEDPVSKHVPELAGLA